MSAVDSVIAAGLAKADAARNYARLIQLPASNGTNDSPVIQAAIDAAPAGSTVRGRPGTTYVLGSATSADKASLYLAGSLTYDFTGCTLRMADGSIGYPIQAAGQRRSVQAPPGLAATPSTSGGTLAAGTRVYQVTAVTSSGETIACPAVTATTTGSTGSVALTWSAPVLPPSGPTITGYKVYGGTAAYNSTSCQLLGTTAAGTRSFTDTGAAGTVQTVPASNATISRTTGIRIIGGTWDANGPNRSCDFIWPTSGKYAGHCFDLHKVDSLRMSGLTVKNATKWAIAIADFTDLVTRDIAFATQADGIHVIGPGDSWHHTGTRGTVGDDLHAVSLAEWPNYAVSAGSVTQVLISEVYASNVPSVLRILGSAGYKIGTLTIEKVNGNFTGTFAGSIYAYDNQPIPGNVNGTDVDKLTIRDVNMSCTGAGSGNHIFLGARNLGRVVVDNIHYDSDYTPAAVRVSSVSAAGTVCTIDELSIRDVTRVGYVANQAAIQVDANAVVRNAVLDSVTARSNLASTGVMGLVLGIAQIDQLLLRTCRGFNQPGVGALVSVAAGTIVKLLHLLDSDAERVYRLIDMQQTNSQIARVVVEGGSFGSAFGEVLRTSQTSALDVILRHVSPTALGATGLVEAQAGSSVTVRASDCSLPAGKVTAFVGSGTPALRVTGAGAKVDVAIISAPQDGDLAFNSNAALGCGVGPAVYSVTPAKWKGLYSGLTN